MLARPSQESGNAHDLRVSPDTIHSFSFDASYPPVLRIEPGDIVRLETATGNPRWFENLETKGLDRATAILLSSAAMDLLVTQVVDGTKGIHAMIPKQVFGE